MVYSFRRGEICKHCKGTGDVSGEKKTCPICGGSGKMTREVKVKDAIKKMEMKCKECGGSGFGANQKCPVCSGNKIIIAPRDLKYELEKGMKGGDVVLFKGESEQGFDFFPGDVYVKLNEVAHPTFKREGNDLKISIDISLKDAILGF
jgi:DnaJ-class molecular chaperone